MAQHFNSKESFEQFMQELGQLLPTAPKYAVVSDEAYMTIFDKDPKVLLHYIYPGYTITTGTITIMSKYQWDIKETVRKGIASGEFQLPPEEEGE